MLSKNITGGTMDSLKENFLIALREAVAQSGSQKELAKSAGMTQSRISDYLTQRYDFDNITVGTLRKIFPELKIQYFEEIVQNENGMELELEKQVVEHFRNLNSADKARYIMLVAANFPDTIKEKTKVQTSFLDS